jgi:hypothetical protein
MKKPTRKVKIRVVDPNYANQIGSDGEPNLDSHPAFKKKTRPGSDLWRKTGVTVCIEKCA